MKFEAIVHRSSRDYIYPVSRQRLIVRLLAARNDLAACDLVCWDRTAPIEKTIRSYPLQVAYRTRFHDDFRAQIDFDHLARFMRYYFKLTDKNGKVSYYNEYGFTDEPVIPGFFEHHYTNEEEVVTPPAWTEGTVYYQIFPERFAIGIPHKANHAYMNWNDAPTNQNYFGGDLPGITAHLDYLADLGINCLYLNPIFTGDFNHKYATTDYFQVDPDFGTNEDLIQLAAKAHQKGIRIILDGVFNHCGEHFPPFLDFKQKGEQSEYADWFLPTHYAADGTPEKYESFEHYPAMPKLRTANLRVREMILKVMLYWVEVAKIDGWRLDVADEIELQTLQIVLGEFRRQHPDKMLIAETWTDAIRLVGSGDLFHSTMNYAFRNAALDFFAYRKIDPLQFDHRVNLLLSNYSDEINSCMYNLLDSHDTPRFLTEAGEDKRRLKLAVAFQMTFIGCPSVYYGDEIGLSGKQDPDCRRTMRWDPAGQDQELHDFYQRLIALREQEPALKAGTYMGLVSGSNGSYAFQRKSGNEIVLIALNNSDQEMAFTLPVSQAGHAVKDLLSGQNLQPAEYDGSEDFLNTDRFNPAGKVTFTLPAMGFSILKEVNAAR